MSNGTTEEYASYAVRERDPATYDELMEAIYKFAKYAGAVPANCS